MTLIVDGAPSIDASSGAAGASAAHVVSAELVMLTDPSGASAEAVRALRTYVVAHQINLRRRALAVCAASSEVGCSFVAVNLAIALAQLGLSTLLIDGDLREPTVSRFIPPTEPVVGLSQYLSAADPEPLELFRSCPQENLTVIYAGTRPENPQELLGGERFAGLIESCLRDYAITIVDTPPANSCSDARHISAMTGYSLVVARRNHTLVEDVKTLVRELSSDHVQVIGTVLNDA